MKIYQKFFFSFVLVAFLVIFSVGIVIMSVINIQQATDRIARENIPELRAAEESTYDIQTIKSSVRALFLEVNNLQRPEEIKYLKIVIKEKISDLKEHTEEWEDAIKVGLKIRKEVGEKEDEEEENKELGYFSDYKTKTLEFIAMVNLVYELNEENKPKEAQQVFDDKERTLSRSLQEIAEGLETRVYDEAVAKSREIEKTVSNTIKSSAIAGTIIIILTFVLGYIISRVITAPLLKLRNAALELGKGKLGVRVDIRSKDEVGELATTFDKMSEDLKKLNEIKDSLTHMIVHDLNNPLTAISGELQLLKLKLSEKITDSEKSDFDIAFRAIGDLQGMISNLLDINKMEEGKIKLNRQNCDLGGLAKEVVEQMNINAVSSDKVLSLEVSDSIPVISADREMIKRIITNLINNALKFTPEKGSVLLKIYSQPEENNVRIQVKDTGRGIPKEYLGKIFDKFVQVESPQAIMGHGLGLTFAKMMVEAHGGKIMAESEGKDKGTTFTVSLPVKTPNLIG